MHTYCTLSLACTLQDNVFVRVVASVMYQVCATSRVLMQVLTALVMGSFHIQQSMLCDEYFKI